MSLFRKTFRVERRGEYFPVEWHVTTYYFIGIPIYKREEQVTQWK